MYSTGYFQKSWITRKRRSIDEFLMCLYFNNGMDDNLAIITVVSKDKNTTEYTEPVDKINRIQKFQEKLSLLKQRHWCVLARSIPKLRHKWCFLLFVCYWVHFQGRKLLQKTYEFKVQKFKNSWKNLKTLFWITVCSLEDTVIFVCIKYVPNYHTGASSLLYHINGSANPVILYM